MNNNLRGSIRSKVFTYETNITKMEEGRFIDCDHMRFHTEGLIKNNTNITRAHWSNKTQSHYIYQEKRVMAEVDGRKILRELQICRYLISAC